MEKKRIFFAINTLGTAGAEKALLELLRALPQEYELDLYVLMNQGELAGDLPERVHLLNRHFDRTPIHGTAGAAHLKRRVLKNFLRHGALFTTFPYLIKHAVRMKRTKSLRIDKLLWRTMAAAGERFDTVYDLAVAYIEGGAAYYVSRYVHAKKKAAFIHVDVREAGYTRELDHGCYDAFDRIFAVSKEVRSAFLSLYPQYENKTDIFRNILNLREIEAKSQEGAGFADDFCGRRILSVGRLNAQKAFEVSIEACARLKERMDEPFRWYVLGEGEERERLEREIAKRGLTEDFLLPGAVANPYPYMRQCDIYAHCSRFEGKSIAIGEARALGKPILVTDTSGNREQVVHMKSGMLVDFSPEAIAEGLERLLRDGGLAASLGKKAKQTMEQEYADNDIYKLRELL